MQMTIDRPRPQYRPAWIGAIGAVVLTGSLVVGDDKADSDGQSPAPFAVVELFTSQGCSSCPPADRLLSDLVKDARNSEARVFCLSFHVDYWNHLGWKDPYSSPSFTQRQRDYVRAHGSRGPYTPQMLVNGRTEFVGSDRRQATTAIDAAMKTKPRGDVRLTLGESTLHEERPGGSRRVTVMFELMNVPGAANLNVAVVERGISRRIERGENAGRTLEHDNVVRVFGSRRITGALGKLTVRIPDDLKLDNASVIMYVQDAADMAILAADAADLSTLAKTVDTP